MKSNSSCYIYYWPTISLSNFEFYGLMKGFIVSKCELHAKFARPCLQRFMVCFVLLCLLWWMWCNTQHKLTHVTRWAKVLYASCYIIMAFELLKALSFFKVKKRHCKLCNVFKFNFLKIDSALFVGIRRVW